MAKIPVFSNKVYTHPTLAHAILYFIVFLAVIPAIERMIQEILNLIKKDILLEWRQKYALGAILLYVASTVFMIYIILNQENALGRLDHKFWSILFWITMLFTAVNAIAKSFTQEARERMLYYYTLVRPQSIIISKMIYNMMLMLLLALLSLVIFSTIIGAPVKNYPIFLVALLLGGTGFSFVLTMISAIASKADNNSTLMAILSFPVLLPLILFLQKLAVNAFFIDAAFSNIFKDMAVLVAFDMILIALSYILFPYLWRD